jgi:hypothetical protein
VHGKGWIQGPWVGRSCGLTTCDISFECRALRTKQSLGLTEGNDDEMNDKKREGRVPFGSAGKEKSVHERVRMCVYVWCCVARKQVITWVIPEHVPYRNGKAIHPYNQLTESGCGCVGSCEWAASRFTTHRGPITRTSDRKGHRK